MDATAPPPSTPRASPARPVRVLELRSTYGYGGGPDKTILLSAARHDPREFAVTVAYLRGAHDTSFNIGQRAAELGIDDYQEIVEASAFSRKTLGAIGRLIRERHIDVVHAHEYKTDILAWLLRQWYRKPAYMTTAHGWVEKTARLRLYNRLDLSIMRRFDRVVAVSGATAERLRGAGVPDRKITLIHNCIDETVWDRTRQPSTLREELEVDAAAPLIGTITRMAPEKDIPTFLEMARRVREQLPAARFVVVGDGPQREDVHACASRLGVEDVVHFTGYRKDLHNVYGALDLHVITSLTEGLPNMLLEAMSMGVATLSTPVGGIPEVVTDGVDGLLRPPGDVEAMTAAAVGLLQDDAERARVAEAGRRTIEQRFSFASRMERIEAVYADLAASRG